MLFSGYRKTDKDVKSDVLLYLDMERSSNMKTVRLILAALLSIPLVLFAQEREFDEIIYILQTELVTYSEESLEDCAEAAQFLPTEVVAVAVWELYSMPTDAENGKALAEDGEIVGQLGACIALGETVEEQVGPLPELPVVFNLAIDGVDYDIGGSGVLRGRAAAIPQPGFGLWSWSATLFKLVDGSPEPGPVGAMTANQLTNPNAVEGYNDGLIVTLRLYSPRDLEQEAIDAFLESLLGG